MELNQQNVQTAPAAKVLLFRSHGKELLREAMLSGVLTPEVNAQIEQVLTENARLSEDLRAMRRDYIDTRKALERCRDRLIQYHRRAITVRAIPPEKFQIAIYSAILFFVTTCVLTIAYIGTLI